MIKITVKASATGGRASSQSIMGNALAENPLDPFRRLSSTEKDRIADEISALLQRRLSGNDLSIKVKVR